MTGFGVNVEADVHVTSGQMDDEVRVIIHWKRCTELVTHYVVFTGNTAAGKVLMMLSKSVYSLYYQG